MGAFHIQVGGEFVIVFLDESGTFACPKSRSGPSLGCVAALAVSERDLPAIEKGFQNFASRWPPGGAEPKGSRLSERQIDRVLTHLGNHDVVLTFVAIDMAHHTEAEIEAHKNDQARRIRTSADGPEFKESMRESVRDLAARVDATSNQLYVESVLLTQAVDRVLQIGKTTFAQIQPEALGSFSWRVDAKDQNPTRYERMWADVVKPMLQSQSMREGLISVEEFDYSHMAPFENPVASGPPAHLAEAWNPQWPLQKSDQFHSINLNKVMADLRFENSASVPGLQLVDIAASAFRRALSGRLAERGWRRLGPLIVRDFPGRAVHYIALKEGSVPHVSDLPYAPVAHRLEREARYWDAKTWTAAS